MTCRLCPWRSRHLHDAFQKRHVYGSTDDILADVRLSRLQQSQPALGAGVIALSEHVDYWNQLGWADPFSSAGFTDRQRQYAEVLHGDGVYTPQMVVDGKTGFVGSDNQKALRA